MRIPSLVEFISDSLLARWRRLRLSCREFSILPWIEKLQHLVHESHVIGTIVGIGIALWDFIGSLEVVPQKALHLGSHELLGVSIILFGWIVKLAYRYSDWRSSSLPIALEGSASNELEHITADDRYLEKIARMADFAFPPKRVSPFINESKRLERYKNWYRINQDSFRCLVFKDDEERLLAGFSIILKLKKEVYLEYISGQRSPWHWGSADIVGKDEVSSYLFAHIFFMHRSAHQSASGYDLRELFLEHLAVICPDICTNPPCIVSPAKTGVGMLNRKLLGFQQIGTSENGFILFQLDLRRPDELIGNALKTFESLKEYESQQ